MSLLNAILNVVGILLWIAWRTFAPTTSNLTPGLSRVSLVRPAGSASGWRWSPLLALFALLGLRAVFYDSVATSVSWSPTLPLTVIAPALRGDSLPRMLLFSVLSFALALGAFLFSLLLLSILCRQLPDSDTWPRWVRLNLGFLARLPWPLKLLVPGIAITLLWAALQPLLAKLGIIPKPVNAALLWQQAGVVGLCAYLDWKYLLLGLLVLHAVHSYVYLGAHPFWAFLSHCARTLLQPLQLIPLQLGRIDLSPLVAGALVVALDHWLPPLLHRLYLRLPL